MGKRLWLPGDPVPDFSVRSSNNPQFHFFTAAGRYLVLCFFGSASNKNHLQAVQHITAHREFFNDSEAAFFGISVDSEDEAQQRVQESTPGIRYFWDFDRRVSVLYGALDSEMGAVHAVAAYQGFTLVLDPMLRVLAYIPLTDLQQHNSAFDYILSKLPSPQLHAGMPLAAPVLVLPRVFEPELCKELVAFYNQHGGSESGFMRDVDGQTVMLLDNKFKRRQDVSFGTEPEFEKLRAELRVRINRRLVPEIYKAFQFQVTRMERYIVACYDSQSGGFFRPHRDNTTLGTAHRRFACTINLNAEEYEGGNLRFPEFGSQTYRAPTGGAVVFSCSLLHEATPVTRGKRFAFLPFFYDEAAAKIREQNRHALTGKVFDKNKDVNEYAV